MIRGGNHRIYINAVVEVRCGIISVRAEGADMPTGKTTAGRAEEGKVV